MSLPLRTAKYTLAVLAAALTAQALGLLNPMTAGVIALLSLSDTRRTTLKLAQERLVSMVLALALAWLLFAGLGFNMLSLALFLIIYVPLSYRLQLMSGLVASTVLVTQLLGWQSLAASYWLNQVGLFAIGAGLALAFNSYMPSKEDLILAHRARIEDQLRQLLLTIHDSLRQPQARRGADLAALAALNQELEAALTTVLAERDNRLFRQTNYDVHYVEIRQAQAQLLEQMMTTLPDCFLESEESKVLAGIFYLTASQLETANPGTYLMADIQALLAYYRERPLPVNRQEFENRARLFQLLNDLSRFIALKVAFYQTYAQDWQIDRD